MGLVLEQSFFIVNKGLTYVRQLNFTAIHAYRASDPCLATKLTLTITALQHPANEFD